VGGAPTFPQGGPHFSPGVSPGGKPCIREQVIPQNHFYRVFLGVFPRGGDPENYKIPSPQRLGASDFHFAPNRPADFSRIVFPFRNSQRKSGPAHGFPLGGPCPPGEIHTFPQGGNPGGRESEDFLGVFPRGDPRVFPRGESRGIALRRVFPRGNSRGFPRGFPLGSLKCHCALPRVFLGVFLGVFHRGGGVTQGFPRGFPQGYWFC